jgi:DNA-binding NarL/FixJ family response regulator
MKAFKILLVEDDPGDLCLFRELVSELHLLPYWRLWKRSIELLIIDLAEDAIDVVKSEKIDLVIFSLAQQPGRGFADFLELFGETHDVPYVVMADRRDESLALAAVREGAQDYLLKTEVDCVSLARAVRYAVEKHKMAIALRNLSPADDLTGMYQRAAFLTLVEHDLHVINSLGREAVLLLARFDGIERLESRENRELLLLDLAETLRDSLPQPTLAGRTAEYDFAFLTVDFGDGAPKERLRETIERWSRASGHKLQARIVAVPIGMQSTEQLLASAEARLCETKAYPLIEQK